MIYIYIYIQKSFLNFFLRKKESLKKESQKSFMEKSFPTKQTEKKMLKRKFSILKQIYIYTSFYLFNETYFGDFSHLY